MCGNWSFFVYDFHIFYFILNLIFRFSLYFHRRCIMSRAMKMLCLLWIIQSGLALHARNRITLAVLDFEGKNTSQETAEAVTELLRTSLFNTGRFTVVERAKVAQILEEQQFQSSGLTHMDQAVEIGRLLNVQKIMAGSLSRLGETFVMNTRIVVEK